ncbi:MAG: DUF2887 domain-containing protein [Synechococcaceae cyanobacterium]
MVASDKLFYWLFQNHPDRFLELQRDLPPEANGWRFSAPVVKEREHRLDGLFQPLASEPELPVVLLEAQMGDSMFLRWLDAPSA